MGLSSVPKARIIDRRLFITLSIHSKLCEMKRQTPFRALITSECESKYEPLSLHFLIPRTGEKVFKTKRRWFIFPALFCTLFVKKKEGDTIVCISSPSRLSLYRGICKSSVSSLPPSPLPQFAYKRPLIQLALVNLHTDCSPLSPNFLMLC